MIKKIILFGALLGAALFASAQEVGIQENAGVRRLDAEFVSEYITPVRVILSDGGMERRTL